MLEAGGVFGIYPEGTRTRDGKLHRGHTGVARLALRTGAPIVPVGIIGSDEVQPIDSKLPRLFRTVTIRFGEPMDLERYQGRHDDRLALRDVADEVMYEIGAALRLRVRGHVRDAQADDVAAPIAHIATLDEAEASQLSGRPRSPSSTPSRGRGRAARSLAPRGRRSQPLSQSRERSTARCQPRPGGRVRRRPSPGSNDASALHTRPRLGG